MIAPAIILEVRRLLAETKLSQRKIAQLAGISRGSVGAIASGRRPDYEGLPRDEDEIDEPAGPPARCGGCGGMVYLPCRLCRVQQAHGRKRQPTQDDRLQHVDESLDLALRPDHRARDDEVRAARQQV